MDWGIIGVVVGVIGVVYAVVSRWLDRRQRSCKELSYREVLNVPLFRVNAPPLARDRLQVMFDGWPVTDARLVVIKLQNTGNQPIRPDDQLTPITFTFAGAEILWTEITSTTPDYLKPVPQWVEGPDHPELMLTPMLFNVGFDVELAVMLKGFRGDVPAPQAQIVGVNEIVRYQDPRDRAPYKYLRRFGPLAAALVSIAVGGALDALTVDRGKPATPSFIPLLLVSALGAFLAVIAVAAIGLIQETQTSGRRLLSAQRGGDTRTVHHPARASNKVRP